jgi:hypothetical protein
MSYGRVQIIESSGTCQAIGQELDAVGRWSIDQEDEARAAASAFLEIDKIRILSEIDKQLLILSQAAAAIAYSETSLAVSESNPAMSAGEFDQPCESERELVNDPGIGLGIRAVLVAAALVAALGFAWFAGSNLYRHVDGYDELTSEAAIDRLVERIVEVESSGNPNKKNGRSSATGLGQFLDQTWLELVRAYRPDLIRGHSESEILALRREATLAREMTMRFVERNAGMLRQRGLPVTAGTVYLAHFAGGAGAVAILSAPANADAALVMANADATGRTKREQILKANPFLEHFTVADLRIWADRKVSSRRVAEGDLSGLGTPILLADSRGRSKTALANPEPANGSSRRAEGR